MTSHSRQRSMRIGIPWRLYGKSGVPRNPVARIASLCKPAGRLAAEHSLREKRF